VASKKETDRQNVVTRPFHHQTKTPKRQNRQQPTTIPKPANKKPLANHAHCQVPNKEQGFAPSTGKMPVLRQSGGEAASGRDARVTPELVARLVQFLRCAVTADLLRWWFQ
jgi:hypothetical protein